MRGGGGREQSGKLIRLALCSSQPASQPGDPSNPTRSGDESRICRLIRFDQLLILSIKFLLSIYSLYSIYIFTYVCVYSSIFAVEIPRLDSHCLHSCAIDLFTIQCDTIRYMLRAEREILARRCRRQQL